MYSLYYFFLYKKKGDIRYLQYFTFTLNMLCVGRSTCASWSTRWSTRMNVRRILWLCMMAAVPLKTSKRSFVALWPMMWCWIMAWESCGCGRTRRADWAASACSSPRLSTVSAFFFHLYLNSFLSFSSITSVELLYIQNDHKNRSICWVWVHFCVAQVGLNVFNGHVFIISLHLMQRIANTTDHWCIAECVGKFEGQNLFPSSLRTVS